MPWCWTHKIASMLSVGYIGTLHQVGWLVDRLDGRGTAWNVKRLVNYVRSLTISTTGGFLNSGGGRITQSKENSHYFSWNFGGCRVKFEKLALGFFCLTARFELHGNWNKDNFLLVSHEKCELKQIKKKKILLERN